MIRFDQMHTYKLSNKKIKANKNSTMGSPIGEGMYVWWNHHAQRKRVVYVI
jgi:hypothetical protein